MQPGKMALAAQAALLLLGAVAGGAACVPASAASVTLAGPLDARSSSSQETAFGDFVADAVLAAAPSAEIALVPSGEMHAVSVPAGQSSTDTLVQALRTGSDAADTVVVMKLTGAQLRAALAHGLSREPGPYDGFLQVAGLTIAYDPAQHGEDRVQKIVIDRTQSPLDFAAVYSVAMPRYLADGALGYFAVFPAGAPYNATNTSLAGAVSAYATNHQPLDYRAAASRITAAK